MSKITQLDDVREASGNRARSVRLVRRPSSINDATASRARAMAMHPSNYRGVACVAALAASLGTPGDLD